MIYSSISGLRGHRDPEPFIVLETESRAGFNELGQVGKTLVFSPRPEFMPSRYHKTNELIDTSRDFFNPTDIWGSGRAVLARLAAQLKKRDRRVPLELEMQLPAAGVDESDTTFDEIAEELGEEEFLRQLYHALEVFSRLVRVALLQGAQTYREPASR